MLKTGSKVRIINGRFVPRTPNTGKILFQSSEKTNINYFWIKFDDGIQQKVPEFLIQEIK